MPKIPPKERDSIKHYLHTAELQTRPDVYPFSSLGFYVNAARKIGRLLEDGYEVPQKLLQRLEKSRGRVYNPRRMKHVQKFGEMYAEGDVYWRTSRGGAEWINRTPIFAERAGVEIPEWYAEIAGRIVARTPELLETARRDRMYPVGKSFLEDAKEIRNAAQSNGILIPYHIQKDFEDTQALLAYKAPVSESAVEISKAPSGFFRRAMNALAS